MSKPFFASKERQEKLVEKAREWLGTPYRHCCKVKGRGADCALLVVGVYEELEIIDNYKSSYYPADWHINGDTELFLEKMQRFSEVLDVVPNQYSLEKVAELSQFKIGDWLVASLNSKGLSNHSAIYIGDGKIIHSLNNIGVIEENIDQYICKITCFYRVFEHGN